jgi:tRNA threonylcarbamoyladenosine biosynthesis protein TsaB
MRRQAARTLGPSTCRMKFYMLVLALDTTTRKGSAALVRDGAIVDGQISDPAVKHGHKLPGDLLTLLDRHGLTVHAIDLFAVAAGPGSLTGLRVGMATMLGLAVANNRGIVGVSALDALAKAIGQPRTPFFGAWMDAQRGEVYAALYRDSALVDGPLVGSPDAILGRWIALTQEERLTIAGDGAALHADAIRHAAPTALIIPDVPPLAGAVGQLAEMAVRDGGDSSPDHIRPMYVRRSDVELARDRQAASANDLKP